MTAFGTGSTVSTLPLFHVTQDDLAGALSGSNRQMLEREILPAFLPQQRWFGAKDSTIAGVTLFSLGEIEPGDHALSVADVSLDSETQRYLLPLSTVWGEGTRSRVSSLTPALAELRSDKNSGVLLDSALDAGLAAALLGAMQAGRRMIGDAGAVVFEATDTLQRLTDTGAPRPLGAEQSNVSIAFGSAIILKLYRRLRAGEQPDVEVTRFLTQVGHFAGTPEFLGEIRLCPPNEEPTTLAAAFAFVPNRGDAWSVITNALVQDLARGSSPEDAFGPDLAVGELLGQRTAEMHKALAAQTDNPAFAVERLTPDDVSAWADEAIVEAEALLDRLEQGLSGLAPSARPPAEHLLARRGSLIDRLRAGAGMMSSGGRSRIHGDYHLGQVLATDGDFVIIDFEGEPKRSLAERRAKSSPLRDVAGMLRSFDYAAWAALNRTALDGDSIRGRAEQWRQKTVADFLRSYLRNSVGARTASTDEAFTRAMIDLFLLQKAIYEVGYELANRPDWVEIPLSGIRDILDAA